MKNRAFSNVLLIVVSFSLFFCTLLYAQETKQQFKDGTYEGKSFKFPGIMKVSVTIKDSNIDDIKILTHLGPKKHTNMLKQLIDKIIKKQSTEVDAVTGATISSNALKKAVNDALLKADIETIP